ncbi:MAG: PIG-L deacetylase family protein [Anaerolineae bacterium]
MTHHLFLSPHLDDAVLSCGGLLAQLAGQGATVTIITVFAQPPPAGRPLSPLARRQHAMWGRLRGAYQTRRAEDETALARLGLKPTWLPFFDCIYRGRPGAGEWYYTADADIFGAVHPAEAGLPAQIAAAVQPHVRAGQTTLYLPLGVGNHVDHQLVRRAAEHFDAQDCTVQFFEDYPYVQRDPAALERALSNGRQTDPRPELTFLSPAELDAKINAVAAYASQLDALFGGQAAMTEQVTRHARAVGQGRPAERYWLFESETDFQEFAGSAPK